MAPTPYRSLLTLISNEEGALPAMCENIDEPTDEQEGKIGSFRSLNSIDSAEEERLQKIIDMNPLKNHSDIIDNQLPRIFSMDSKEN